MERPCLPDNNHVGTSHAHIRDHKYCSLKALVMLRGLREQDSVCLGWAGSSVFPRPLIGSCRTRGLRGAARDETRAHMRIVY